MHIDLVLGLVGRHASHYRNGATTFPHPHTGEPIDIIDAARAIRTIVREHCGTSLAVDLGIDSIRTLLGRVARNVFVIAGQNGFGYVTLDGQIHKLHDIARTVDSLTRNQPDESDAGQYALALRNLPHVLAGEHDTARTASIARADLANLANGAFN